MKDQTTTGQDKSQNVSQKMGQTSESVLDYDLTGAASLPETADRTHQPDPNTLGVGAGGGAGVERSSKALLRDVLEALQNVSDVDAPAIRAEVHDGEVTLAGDVQDNHQKTIAEDVVMNLQGVKQVHNNIHVGIA
jgi:osmotically-inducible protein OsmY